jgi:predicted glycosyltransferase involved in capsule biosynthesis
MMRKALREWPIRFNGKAHQKGTPDISFVIPHRGAERLPLLQTALQTILSQRGISIECIVVEQSAKPEITELLPGIRHIHLPHKTNTNGWYKSWAFNIGVKDARANIVVCHDGDILVPCDYGREILKHMGNTNLEVLHLQRFLFCLNQTDTNKTTTAKKLPNNAVPERVRQNWQGGTLAIKKNAFFRIGGYDERFVGWGGEDNEFYDRCTTLNGWRYGYLPFIHLWHESQPEKLSAEREQNLKYFRALLKQAPEERIALLNSNQNMSY